MAYLNPPFTIIDSQPDLHQSLKSIVSAPPAATWFDEDRQHFVALKAAAQSQAGSGESTAGSLDSSVLAGALYGGSDVGYEAIAEVVQYQALGLPHISDQSPLAPKDEELTSAYQRQSAFDAAKEAAESGRNTLITEVLVAFHLPYELVTVQPSDDGTTSTEANKSFSRRIPILAKFSEKIDGVRFLALQYTPTMLRIINVEHNKNEQPRDDDKHWTIDLSYGTNPVPSAPETLPSWKERGSESDTAMLGGGVVWCKGANGTLSLILITTTAVLIYEMNIVTKNLRKLRVYPHPPATSFWFESISRVLIIGSYKSHNTEDSNFPGIVMEMKTLFFNENGAVETLPPFVVGSLREKYVEGSSEDDFSDIRVTQANEEIEDDIVSPTDLSLVCLDGDVFCVEMGSLGCGRGIGVIKLDRANRCIHVRQQKSQRLRGESVRAESTFVGVVDNLLCIFLRELKSTMFLDIPSLFSDDSRELTQLIESQGNDTRIYDGSLSFLAPSFFLYTDGDGLLYEVKVDIEALLQAIPTTACIVPFLLRRNEPRKVMLQHILGRFDALVKLKDVTTLETWLGVIVEQYSKSEAAIQWDSESTDDLILPVSFLSELDKLSHADEIDVPGSCRRVLTQAEMLRFALLKHAKLAIESLDTEYLEVICHISVKYLIEIERRCHHPCFALQGLVIALLLKQRRASELLTYLCARETEWTQIRRMRQMNIPSRCQIYFDFPKLAVIYAEMLFNTAISCTCERSRQRLITHATTILLGCNAHAAAVKCLLSAGRLEDAIALSLKRNRLHKDSNRLEDTIQASVFFNAIVERARLTESVGDRCIFFYHLHCFLRQTFPTEFIVESRKIRVARRTPTVRRASFTGDGETVAIEQSKLAHECKFPDDLFGGISNPLCLRLRLLFGYSSSVR